MHYKDIKNIVRRQIKKEYPNWTRIVKKEKRAIAKMVLNTDFHTFVNRHNYTQLAKASTVLL